MKRFSLETNERASSEVVALLMSIILLISICIISLDIGMFYNNRSTIQSVARDGARTVAILGGAGDEHTMTKLEKAYGTEAQISASVKKSLENHPALMNVIVKNVECGPYRTAHVGDETYCKVTYEYYPLPGDPLNLVSQGLGGDKTVTGTAQSEVKTDPIDMTARK